MNVIAHRHSSTTTLIIPFLIIILFISTAQAQFDIEELPKVQDCADNSAHVITCSSRCDGCQLETGRHVYCDFVNEDEFVILRGVLRKSERAFDILHYVRVGCFLEGSNYRCPKVPGVREPSGNRRCYLRRKDRKQSKSRSSNRTPSVITSVRENFREKKKEESEIASVSEQYKQERSYPVKLFYRLLSTSFEIKKTLTSKKIQAPAEHLNPPKSIFKEALIHHNIPDSSELSRFENHCRDGKNTGCSTTNIAGVSVRATFPNCRPKPITIY